MSEGSAGDGIGAGQRLVTGASRLARAWRKLPSERRLAAVAAILLFLTLFLPWYQETVIASGTAAKLQSASTSLTGWGAFSFVEAAILLIVAGILVLLFQRAEGRAFHIPAGDGGVIMVAGLWACVLIIWRIFDKQGTSSHGQYVTTSGIEWGIFVALAIAGLLAYAGSRIRLAHSPEPPLPGERRPPQPPSAPGEAQQGRSRSALEQAEPGGERPIRSQDDTLPAPPNRSQDDTLPAPPNRSQDDTLPAPPNRSQDDTIPMRASPADDSPTLRVRRARPTAGEDEQMTIPLERRTPES